MSKTCCFSGYRPQKLPYLDAPKSTAYTNLLHALRKAVRAAVADGYDTFLSGFAEGVDLLAASVVLSEGAANGQPLHLVAAIPYPGQSDRWRPAIRQQYATLLHACKEVIYICREYHAGCFQERNEYMVNRSQRLIAVYDGQKGGTANTVRYALKNDREVILINPRTFAIREESALRLF